jgi:hypothetical protein
MGIIVVASCIPWLRHQHFFSIGVGVTAIVLAGLLVTGGVHAVSTWSKRQQSGSQPSSWLSPRLRNWLLMAVLLGLLIPVVSQFVAKSSDAYKLAVATAHQTPQFTEALGAPIREEWFSEGRTEYGNPTKAELTIPVKGSRGKGDLRALAIKEDGRWKLKELTLELAQSGERIDLLANAAQPRSGESRP